MLPFQIWANTTFKSPGNPRHQLTTIPLWFLLDMCPTIMFQPSSQLESHRILLLPFLSETPHQYKHDRFNCTALPPEREPHIPQGADPWSQRVLTSELCLHQRGLVKCKAISQLSSMLNRQLQCWLIDYSSLSKLYQERRQITQRTRKITA